MSDSVYISATSASTSKTDRGIIEEAVAAEGGSDALHEMLDMLERRLFGPEPREVTSGNRVQSINEPFPETPLIQSVRAVRQRLDSARSRLDRILGRL